MGLGDFLGGIGRDILSLPGKLNEARYTHQDIYVPVGKDPDTGEDIKIPAADLQRSYWNPETNAIYAPQPRRTGQSGFGKFVQGLPGILSAGIHAASAPTQPGAVSALNMFRSMDIGRDFSQKQNMIAY